MVSLGAFSGTLPGNSSIFLLVIFNCLVAPWSVGHSRRVAYRTLHPAAGALGPRGGGAGGAVVATVRLEANASYDNGSPLPY
jgi:hypothetical protein